MQNKSKINFANQKLIYTFAPSNSQKLEIR